jgi:hypothetical protein
MKYPSDVDFAIFSDNLSYVDLVDLEDKISERLNKEVDLVLPEKNDVLLLREILQGKSLMETSEGFADNLTKHFKQKKPFFLIFEIFFYIIRRNSSFYVELYYL